jgi:hypothetical protein
MSEEKKLRTVLIVEPDFGLARLTSRVLRPHQVLHAATLGFADDLLARYLTDVLVFDPEQLGGFDFLVATAREYPELRMVAYSQSPKADDHGAFGLAHATLRKPASDREFREAVLGNTDRREHRTLRRSSG